MKLADKIKFTRLIQRNDGVYRVWAEMEGNPMFVDYAVEAEKISIKTAAYQLENKMQFDIDESMKIEITPVDAGGHEFFKTATESDIAMLVILRVAHVFDDYVEDEVFEEEKEENKSDS